MTSVSIVPDASASVSCLRSVAQAEVAASTYDTVLPTAPSFALIAAAIAITAGSCSEPAITSESLPAVLRSAINCANTSLPCSARSDDARACDASASTPLTPSSFATSAAKIATSLRRIAKRSSALIPVMVSDGSTTYMRDCVCFDASALSMRRPFAQPNACATFVLGLPSVSSSSTRIAFAFSSASIGRETPSAAAT